MYKKSKRALILISVLVFGVIIPIGTAEGKAEEYRTILTAERVEEIITVDGHADEASWADANSLAVTVQDGSIGEVDVVLRALYDRDHIYIHVTWPDPTKSVEKKLWTFNGSKWSRSGDEDRFAIFWNIDDSVKGFNIGGCAMLCHGDRMHANSPDEKADSWHWKASRSNPAGYADDKFVNETVVPYEYGPLGVSTKWVGRHGDEKIGGGYRDNVNEDKTGPKYYEPNPSDLQDAKFIFQSEIDKGEAIEITDETTFTGGDTVPGYILEKPTGSRGDIIAKGVWENGVWSLELKRKLNTGHDDDVQFDIAKTYRFGIAVMDNAGGFEGFGKGHSFDLGAKTLEFGGIGSEEVTRLALVRDYLITANSYVNADKKGLAISTVNDALTVYNRVRNTLADKDPDLHIAIRNGFVESRRNPSEENLDALMQRIDDATLTLQGKREPKEPTWGLKLLALWGKVQLYVFILLAVLVIYPIYRTLKTSRLPELRYMSLFVFLVIMPVFIEGVGRLGILLQIPFLESMSFMTNEYLTLGWVILMYIAIFVGRLGFNEVDHTIGSLRDKRIQLQKDIEKRKKLEEEIKKSYAELDTIYKITAAVNKSLDLNETLYDALRGEMESFKADMGAIYLLDKERGVLNLAVQRGMSDKFVRNNSTIKLDEQIIGKVAQTGEYVIVDDSKKNGRVTLSVVKTEGYGSLICLPLKYRKEIVGSIAVLSRTPHHFKEGDVDFLTSVGEQIAVAIENARLYTKTKELSDNLEKKVEKRTIELQEAYNELKTIDKMKDELISNVSHELRTPLTIAESSIGLVLDGELTFEQETLLKKGSENLDRLNALIGELIAYAKISEHPDLKLKIDDINEIILKSVEKFSPLAERENVTIKTSLEDTLPKITVDKKKVEHIMYNLLSNAIKFNRKGGWVEVKTSKNDGFVEVSVEDTGIGIEEKDQKKVFEKFFQLDGSIKRRYPGTGIGLAIVKSYVEVQGGKIWIKSKIGKGSTFTFTLPIRRA